MKKKILSIFLAVAILVGLFPIVSYSALPEFIPVIYVYLDGQPASPGELRTDMTDFMLSRQGDGDTKMLTEAFKGYYTYPTPITGTYNFIIFYWDAFEFGSSPFLSWDAQFSVSSSSVLTINCHTVTYRPGTNGTGAVLKDLAATGKNFTLANAMYSRSGYVQSGWATSDGGSKVYDLGEVTGGITTAVDFYPVWSEVSHSVTINVKKDDVAWGAGSPTITFGTTAGTAVANGSSVDNGTYNIYANGNDTDEDVTVNGAGVSTDLNYYTVTFKDDDNSTLDTQITLSGQTPVYGGPLPSKAGYIFAGWDRTFTNITTSTVVTATYSANTNTAYRVEHYKEKLTGGYDLFETDKLTGTTDTIATATTKTYTGFSENTSHAGRVASDNIKGDGTTVLKLYYDRIEYTVIYRDWDNAILKTEEVKHEETVSFPVSPVRKGYLFRGWFEDQKTLVGFSADTPISKDTVIYSGWTVVRNDENQDENIMVVVNGQRFRVSEDNIAGKTGERTVEVRIDSELMNKAFDEAVNDQSQVKNKVEIPVPIQGVKRITAVLTGDVVKRMESDDFVLAITSNDISYIIPAEEINIGKLAQKLGVGMDRLIDIEVKININLVVDDEVTAGIEEKAKDNGYELILPPMSFEITASTKAFSGEEKR